MKTINPLLGALALTAALWTAGARADIVTLNITGNVQDSFGTEMTSSPTYNLVITYDTSVPDTDSDPNHGSYAETDGSMSFTAGSLALTLPLTDIEVGAAAGGDSYIDFYTDTSASKQIKFLYEAESLTSDGLPSVLPAANPIDAGSTALVVADYNRENNFNGVLDGSPPITPVPEPGTMALLALPTLLLVRKRKVRQR